MTTHPQRLLAYALIALGAFLLLLRLGGADWLWLALLGGVFLFGYSARRTYGFLVAGGVLLGLAVGTLLDSSAGLLLSLAAGFYAVDRVEPKSNRWALYSAGIFAALGVFVALGSFRLLNSVFFALVLIAVGVWLLYRGEGKVRPVAGPGDSRPGAPDHSPPSPPTPNPSVTAAPTTATPATPVAPTPNIAATSSPEVRAPDGSSSPAASPSYNAPYGPNDVSPPPVVTEAETPHAAASAAPPPPAPLSEAAQRRLERLSAWRRETAAAEGTPAYIVFSNDTLAKIAAAEPQTVEDLGHIRGVGPVKLSRYGEAVLRVLHEQV